MCLHVEAKTAVLVETLLAGGAEVAWTGSPATTDDGVAAAMTARENLRIYALKADDVPAHHAHIARVLRSDPDMLLDNGADLIAGTIEVPGSRVVAATEETTSGRIRLTDELAGRVPFPVIVINDSPIKLSFESERGIGPAMPTSRNIGGRPRRFWVRAGTGVGAGHLLAQVELPGLDVAGAVPDADVGDLMAGRGVIGVVEHGVDRHDRREARAAMVAGEERGAEGEAAARAAAEEGEAGGVDPEIGRVRADPYQGVTQSATAAGWGCSGASR